MQNNKENKIECCKKCYAEVLNNCDTCPCHIPKQEERKCNDKTFLAYHFEFQKDGRCEKCNPAPTKEIEEKSNKWEVEFDNNWRNSVSPFTASLTAYEDIKSVVSKLLSHQKQEWNKEIAEVLKCIKNIQKCEDEEMQFCIKTGRAFNASSREWATVAESKIINIINNQ